MPEMDGIEATVRIKSNANHKSIFVVALTAHAQTGERERILNHGFDDYLTKPIHLKDLRDLFLNGFNSSDSQTILHLILQPIVFFPIELLF